MKHFKTLVSPLCLAALTCALALSAPLVAQAQPDPNNVPKAQNPDNRAVRPRLTPEQRDAKREEMRQLYMTTQLERVGVTDKDQQTAVADYIKAENDAADKLQTSGGALGTALRTKAVTDKQVAVLLNDYNVAIEDDRARRKAAQKKLGESIDLLKNPRLEAFLTLMGLYGDGPAQGNNWMGRGRN